MIQQTKKNLHLDERSSERKIGKYYALKKQYDRQISPLLTLGPEIKCAMSVFLLVNMVSFYILFCLSKSQEGRLYYLVFMVVLIYWDIAWITCTLINPGIATNETTSLEGNYCKECLQKNGCLITQKLGRKHCDICQICVDEQYQHCTMTGNCIGKDNYIANYFFLLGMFLWIIDISATIPFVYYL